ncbi:condensation domain-containing protein [Corynebacterium parakroppenstedtii]|uniref:Condensation domain-containing protein n=1 Tax=Corynebacterium parakroppenstedtii TaxID=2828363 RepID=A0ABS9HKN6_9CORY|nr:condensation domain-containing protein [Corynebacterium parakroppenstedtii]UWY21805.1 condensation domain-containing protein [Corynebacterium kroppenstedtii]MBY0792531.1 AMP-binding protein [Corynebacterium parakroppenstedtii]MCF6769888.1 condensation domain-containing protein [Corynebacterium parakroppenstedtii]MCF6771986.1 condensation domain-containing protein [Corynebacterium parakroppenstedtii]MCF6774384.1 condensation domain-containing protein [Corynebacterium parakroppenstedtii]
MTFDSVRASDPDNPTSPDWFPLTAAQMGIWNAQSLDPSSPYYVVGEVMELDPTDSQPDISVADVVQALHQTVAEAETLRLQFRQEDATDIRADDSAGEDADAVRADDSPRQRVIDAAPGEYITIPVHDLRAHPAPEAAANAYVDAAKARCAEAWSGLVDRPLCHFEVLRLDHRRVWIIQLYHHLIVDGYASMILARRTAAHYTELTGGKKARPAKFSGLRSVVKEDREYHESDNRDRDAQWWQESLAGVGSTQWRDELIGGSESSSRTTVLTVDADELDAWKAASQQHGTTWVDSLLAAYGVYLRRVQGVEADELVVAMPFAARETAAQRRTPAMMVNMLPVQLPIDLTATLPQNAHAVEKTMRTVREHQRFPGAEVATAYGDSSILRGIGANLKVFDAALKFGKTRGYLRNVAGGPPENLVLVAAPGRSGGVDLSFETVADVPPQVVHQWLSDIRAVVNVGLGLDRRSQAESALPVASEIRIRPERIPTGLREQWDGELLSDSSSDDPSRDSIEPLDSLINSLAQRWGDRVVLADGLPEALGTTASYTGSELVKQCDQLADSIASVCPAGGVVAIEMPKSPAQAVAVLASLRAHRAFVVIDDDAPQERRSFIMKDSGAAAVVTGLDDVQPVERGDGEKVAAQDHTHESDELAYIVYTSGTTGRPKGVNVSRRAVEHLIAGHRAQFFPQTLDHVAKNQPQASAALAHTASFAFDAAIDQLSWIFAGVRVVIYNRSTVADGEAFYQSLRRDDITMIDATPSLFGALLASGVPLLDAQKSQIRAVLLGGEPMSQQLWDQVAAASHVIGWNMYGPSEATVDALCARITPGAVTVGWPVPGMSIRICDASGEVVPPGEEGELWLMGEQIAQGYRNNPDATAHAFFRADVTASRPRADVSTDAQVLVPAYRTGDRVRWVPGRGVAFIGRADNQIEVRGHRVELEEIDGALAALPGVRAAGTVAVARNAGDASRPDDKDSASTGAGHTHVGAASVNIRAGIVLEGLAGNTPASNDNSGDPQLNTDDVRQRLSELRQHLSRILPDYMVPSTLVAVAQIPRTSTEKIDRRALRELIEQSSLLNDRAPEHQGNGDHQGSDADLRAPETPRELAVSRVIQDVMGQPADLDVDFINQGGDSITALVVAGRLQQQGFEIRPADILSGRSLGEIVASLRRSSSGEPTSASSAIFQTPETGTDGHINPEPRQNILTDFGVVDAPSGMDRSAFTGPNQPVMSVVIPCASGMDTDECRVCATRLAEDVPALRSIATWDADNPGSEQLIIRRHPAEDDDFLAPVDLAAGRPFAFELVDGGVRLSVHSAVVDADGFAQLIGIVEALVQRSGHGDGHSDGRQHRYASWRGHSASALPWAHSCARATATIEPSLTKALLSNLGTKFGLSDQNILTAAALIASAGDHDETLTAMVLSRVLRQPSAPAAGQSLNSGNAVARDAVGRFAAPGYVTVSPSESRAQIEALLLSVKEQRANFRATNSTDTSASTPAVTLELGHIPGPTAGKHPTLIPTHHTLRPGFPGIPHITAWITGAGTGTGTDPDTPDHHTAPVGNEPGEPSISMTVDAETDDRAEQLADGVVNALTDLAVFGLSAEASASPSDCLAPVTSADIEHWQRRFGPLQNVYGLSPLQEGLLYQALDSRERDHYVIAASMTVEGTANPELLRFSFEAVMNRQDVLKAAFDYETLDRPVHVIPRTPRWQWSVIDARGLPSRVQSSLIDDVLDRMASRQLDVTRGNMVASTLVRLGDRRSQLVLGNHHILTDGWSTTILLRELMHVYNRAAELLASGNAGDVGVKANPLESAESTLSHAIASAIAELPPRYPYGQFVEDMQPRVKADTELWIDHVAGLDHTSRVMDVLTSTAEPDALAPDSANTDADSGEEHCIVELSDQQKADLSRCARTVGVTPNTLIQTAWACVVAALTGHDDAVFGVVTSGRPSELDGIDNTIGLFINTLPVRVNLRGDSLASILRAHARAQAELADHTSASLADIERRVDDSRGEAPLSGPLFDSLVVYDNFPDEFSETDTQPGPLPDSYDRAPASRGIRITGLTTRGETQYPLTVIHPPGGPFDLALAYQLGVVPQQVADTLADALRATLSRCAAIDDVESPDSLRVIRDDIASMLDNIRRQPVQNADGLATQDHAVEPASEPTISSLTNSNQPNADNERPDPNSQLLRDICDDIAGLLNRPEVDPDVAFEDLGVHSLMAVRLMGKLRKRGHKLDIQTIVEAGSPRGIVRAIGSDSPQAPAPQPTIPTDTRDNDSRPPWMVTLKEGKGRPLFCFHAIDGSVFSYQGLAEYLTTGRPIIGIQFPADISDPLSWNKAVDLYASAIHDYQPEGSYTFVGFSFGATIAHAVSARLNQQRDTATSPVVDLLVVLDAYPARAGLTPPPIPNDLNVDLLSDITGFSAHDLRADDPLRDRSERSVRACARWMGEVSDTPVRGIVKKVVLITAEKAPIVRNTSGVVERPKPDQQAQWNPAEAWENTGVELRTHSVPLDHGGLASLAGWKSSAPTIGEELE